MRLSPFSRVTPIFAVSAIVLVFALAACGSDDDDAGNAPAAGGATPVPTLVTIPTAEPPAPGDDGADGSAASGEALFASNGCSACHSTGANTIVGPGLQDIGESAAGREAGLSADQYLEESIRDPGGFLVEGFANIMPATFASLPDSDVADLIAYLKGL